MIPLFDPDVFYASERMTFRMTKAQRKKFGALVEGEKRLFKSWTDMILAGLDHLYGEVRQYALERGVIREETTQDKGHAESNGHLPESERPQPDLGSNGGAPPARPGSPRPGGGAPPRDRKPKKSRKKGGAK